LYTLFCSFFFCMLLPPPRSPLFPYTTLFRSEVLTTSEFSSEIPKYLAYANAPNIGFPLVVDLFALLITFLVTALVYRGINESRKASNIMVIVKVAVVLLVIVIGAFYVNTENWSPFAPNGISGVLAGI